MKKLKLAPYFSLGTFNKELHLGFGSIQIIIRDAKEQKAALSLISFLNEARTYAEIENFLQKAPLKQITHDIYNKIYDKKLLIEDGVFVKSNRYSRHVLFYNMYQNQPLKVQNDLSKKHVVILGCGGIGSVISVNLATAGLGKITLIDQDHIEMSNLTRQILFTESDLGKSKVKILKKQLDKRASNIEVNYIEAFIDTKEKLKVIPKCDLIVLSGDYENLVFDVNDYCFKNKIPFINVGYIQDIAVWGPLILPGSSPCFKCFSATNVCNEDNIDKNSQDMIKAINKKHQAPSIGPVNMLASSLAALDILKYLGGFGEVACLNQRIGIWTHNLEITYQKNVLKACDLCRVFHHEC